MVAPDARLLRCLARTVEAHGLALFLAAFPPHSVGRQRWAREARSLPAGLRDLVDLFLLGNAVPVRRLPAGVADALPVLAAHDVAVLDADLVRLPEVVLFRPLGTWLFAEPPGPLVVGRYFGADSVALAMHATVGAGATCLDLCAGPGFQALQAAGRASAVTAVELRADGADLATVNVALNGLADRVRVLVGDLYAPLDSGVRYDHVIANVPFMPVPAGLPFPTAGAGGPDGFTVGRGVLDGLPARLADGGTAHVAALLRTDDDGAPSLADELGTWAKRAGARLTVTLVGRMPVGQDSPLVQGTAAAIVAAGGDRAGVADEVAALYAGSGGASWAFLRVDAGGDGFEVVDLGRSGRGSPWVSMI